MMTDSTDQKNCLLTDIQSLALCTNADEYVLETFKSLSGQTPSFMLDSARRHALITQADLLNFYRRDGLARDTSGELRPPAARLSNVAVPSLRTLAD